ncbi:hypothetical protein QLS31_02490 [Flavobacterium sp. XS2P24]|uniref:hypothetical protein n=1 Tax=Flavobacterium sp. XS2P24 TaxID=3041249 RepID=UPI0024A87FAF|nr:hypothetical protein [Flavobacterium sp. XS2P24]MDI6048690.1 hypothetical protein [Flavobacterium sp. XS2P24]
MMRINDIQEHFQNNVTKKTLQEISWYQEKINEVLVTKYLINSQKLSFDFDTINPKVKTKDTTSIEIKTADTVYFKDEKVIFVEFKSSAIKKIEFRLKATESIISFYNYIFKNGFTEQMRFPNDTFQIYFVYNQNCTPARLQTFSLMEKELNIEYKHFFSKLKVIDNNKFKSTFGI